MRSSLRLYIMWSGRTVRRMRSPESGRVPVEVTVRSPAVRRNPDGVSGSRSSLTLSRSAMASFVWVLAAQVQ